MHNVNISGSFRVRSLLSLDELKAKKIQALKDTTYALTTEKYPLYKQINSGKSGSMQIEISKIRSICNKIEEKIKACENESQVLSILVDEANLKRAYGL